MCVRNGIVLECFQRVCIYIMFDADLMWFYCIYPVEIETAWHRTSKLSKDDDAVWKGNTYQR